MHWKGSEIIEIVMYYVTCVTGLTLSCIISDVVSSDIVISDIVISDIVISDVVISDIVYLFA